MTGLITEGDRAVGIRGTSEECARMVIGADGAHSLVAHSVKAPSFNQRESTAGAWYAYWEGGPKVEAFETYVRAQVAGAAFPTNDGLTCGGRLAPFGADSESAAGGRL